MGKPGTGKSHIAKALAYQATLAGHDERYPKADAEFARYAMGNVGELSRTPRHIGPEVGAVRLALTRLWGDLRWPSGGRG